MITAGSGYRIGSRRSQVNAGIQRVAYQYWALALNSLNGGTQAGMKEVRFYNDLGQQVTVLEWYASSSLGGFTPNYLGDGNNSTVWQSDTGVNPPHYVFVALYSPTKIRSVSITAGPSGGAPTQIALYGGDYAGDLKEYIGTQFCSWSYVDQVNTLTYY